MFCPRCGAQSDGGKFCRGCGTNLALVSDALSEPEQARKFVEARRGGPTLGLFHSTSLSNGSRSLDGLTAISAFGSVTIDLRAGPVPAGEIRFNVFSLCGSIEVFVPEGVGLRITGVALLSGLKVSGQSVGNGVFSVNEYTSRGYADAARRVHIDATSILSGVKVRK